MTKRVDIHLTINTADEPAVSDVRIKLALETIFAEGVTEFNNQHGDMNIKSWKVRVLDTPTSVMRSVTPVPIMEDADYVIHGRAPELCSRVEYPGCIVVKLSDKYEAWFGTANETWDASITDITEFGAFVDDPHIELLNTSLSCETRDCVVLGQAIIDAVQRWKEAHGK